VRARDPPELKGQHLWTEGWVLVCDLLVLIGLQKLKKEDALTVEQTAIRAQVLLCLFSAD
jgi:hypothetical protein